jgi:hypothetical protein
VSTKVQLGDNARLILTALVVAAAAIVGIIAILYFVPLGYTHGIRWKWVRFGIVSVGFMGYAIKAYWKLRGSWLFWSIFLTFFVAHVLCLGYFFYAGEGLPLLLFGPACGLELMGMALVIYRALGVGPDKVSVNL